MKATEIVEKLKSVLLSSDEVKVEEIAVNEEVALEEMPEEMPEVEAPEVEEPKYVTKEELESALAEMKAMYDQLMEKMGSEEMETEVPAEELSAVEPQEVDLSADEPAAEPIAHSPEVEQTARPQFFSGIKPQNTMGVVYQKMFNK